VPTPSTNQRSAPVRRTLVSRADLHRRDTGINGLYLGFPFVLIKPHGENVKPRIAPVVLWPIRIGTEVGQRARFTVGFDRDREEVRLNPALQNIFSDEEMGKSFLPRRLVREPMPSGRKYPPL
jgi:hypothetical protein